MFRDRLTNRQNCSSNGREKFLPNICMSRFLLIFVYYSKELLMVFIVQGIEDSGEFVKQYFADLVFYLTLNFIGFYFRYVGEVESTQDIVSSASCEKHQSLADQHAEGLPGQAQLHRDHLQAQVREGAGGQSLLN